VQSDMSVLLVVENSHSMKPLIYKIAGAWWNHEGSMLLWVTVLAISGAGSRYLIRQRDLYIILFGSTGMTTFDKREEGFERKFALDEEMKFRATARRNKLLGQWAAEKLGLSGAEAEAYVKAVVAADFEEAGDDDVFRKVRKDFDAKKVEQSDHQIRRTMDELFGKALQQLQSDA